MLSLEASRQRIFDQVSRHTPRQLPFDQCWEHVTAAPVVSAIPVPPFANSAMDGYAVRQADVATASRETPVALRVIGVAAAGHPAPQRVGPGEAVRILTGAVMVEGADTVVPVEWTRQEESVGEEPACAPEVTPDRGTADLSQRDGRDGRDGAEASGGNDLVKRVLVEEAGPKASHVRGAGEDVPVGAVAIPLGTRLNAAHLGVAASVGAAELLVYPAPRVAVVSTGDELRHPGEGPLAPGQIYDSNCFVIAALLRSGFNICAPTVFSCGDDIETVRSDLLELAASHDLILSTGGVSMGGEYDAVKMALSDLGVEFWQTAIKPAKPIGFGLAGGAVFFCLPGNPVSAVVAFELYVRPAVRKMMGITPVVPPFVQCRVGTPLQRPDDGKTHFVRVQSREGSLYPTGGQGSHMLSGLALADALAVLPPGKDEWATGQLVPTIPLNWARERLDSGVRV